MSKKFSPRLNLDKGVLIVANLKLLTSVSILVFVLSMAHYNEPLIASWSSSAIVSCLSFHIFVSGLLIQARVTRQQKHILPFLVVDGFAMLEFLYLTTVNLESILYSNLTLLFNSMAALLVVLWILQVLAYIIVLAFWKQIKVGNPKPKIISPIYKIFPSKTSEYEKFINKHDPAFKAVSAENSDVGQVGDRLLLFSYFVLIAVNCYLFAVI